MDGVKPVEVNKWPEYGSNERKESNPPSRENLTRWDSIKLGWEMLSIRFNAICELPVQKMGDLCDKHPCVGIPLLIVGVPTAIALGIATSPIIIVIYLAERLKVEVCSPSLVSRAEDTAIRAKYGLRS